MLQRQTKPQVIYQRLAQLRIGAAIPADIYIADRADGSVPRWVVINRRVVPQGGAQLLVEDQSPEQLHLKVSTDTERRPRFAIEAFPAHIRGARVYAGEHGWPKNYPVDLVHLAQGANVEARTRAQAASSRPSVAVQPPSPWYQATVKDESALSAHYLAALPPSSHGFHEGTQIVVRFYRPGKWAAWDKEMAALVVEEAIARLAFVTRKDGRIPLRADNQENCEAGFRAAMARRPGKCKNSEEAK